MDFTQNIARTLSLQARQVNAVIMLLDEGATVPFIARYRKERTGMLDEEQIIAIKALRQSLQKLEDRRSAILDSLAEQNIAIPDLIRAIKDATLITELEDLYLPYKPKRKTRASMARDKGLEPLAKQIFAQQQGNPREWAKRYICADVADIDAALAGASDIMAEWISENADVRQELRQRFEKHAVLSSKVIKSKADEAAKFSDYFSFSEPCWKIPSHRFMAVMRGAELGYLRISALPDEEKSIGQIRRMVVKERNAAGSLVELAITDAYTRLLSPSLENELLDQLREKAEKAAVVIFAANLRQLLMAPPLGSLRVLGIDPGFKSGCKLVCLDAQGQLLHNETVYPHAPQNQDKQAMSKISHLIETYKIEAVAIGNGTAGRETEQLIQRMRLPAGIKVFVVSESGASVYSASKVARDEFPQYDVTVRGAVSIGRRLQDPLSELVKIEPSAVGVGQYQHDVDAKKLNEQLDDVVRSCVNQVGVNLNMASEHLLAYVAGLNKATAAQITAYRAEIGHFKNRQQLLEVPRLGKKTFEQCAGFLRIADSNHPLDNSAVHPERYALVEKMAKDHRMTLSEIIGNKELKNKIDYSRYITEDVGLPTLEDIFQELEKPGRDPRKQVRMLQFEPSIRKPDDLQIGMLLPGIVTNITAFGA
ncbi:MAG: Tex family protein, partial [Bacteroidia bacterium]